MENAEPRWEFGYLMEDYEPFKKTMKVVLFNGVVKTYHAGAVRKAGRKKCNG